MCEFSFFLLQCYKSAFSLVKSMARACNKILKNTVSEMLQTIFFVTKYKLKGRIMRINYKKLYLDRIEIINQDIKKAVRTKNWSLKNKLIKEKKELENKINEMQVIKNG